MAVTFAIDNIAGSTYSVTGKGKYSCSTKGILSGVTLSAPVPPYTETDWISEAYYHLDDLGYAVGLAHPFSDGNRAYFPYMELKSREVKFICNVDTDPITAKFEVTLSYDNTYEATIVSTNKLLSFSGTTTQHETDKDYSGASIEVSYTGEEDKIVPVNRDYVSPQATVEFLVAKSGYSPITEAMAYLNKTNNDDWLMTGDYDGTLGGLWKCTAFDFHEEGQYYSVSITCSYSEVGWRGLVAWTDENGKVPADATRANGGIAEPTLYGTADFSNIYPAQV